jgi:hypothetical protein
LFDFAALLLGESAAAEQAVHDGYHRVADEVRRDNVLGDATEILYRGVARSALTQLAKKQDLDGYQPSTAADADEIAAFRVLSSFSPQQRAAVLLAVRAETGYRLAGLATGVGEARTQDLAFAAEQQFGEAAGKERAGDRFGDAVRRAVAPAPAREPGEIAEEAAKEALAVKGGWRRLLRLASGPAVLTAVLIAAILLIPQCGEPSIKTGVGRTSDIAYGYDTDGKATVAMDTGSGKALVRLPVGVVTRDGRHLYFATPTCNGNTCRTRVQMTDTATQSTSDVVTLDGRLAVLDVDEERRRVYLGDEGNNWGRLLVVDTDTKQFLASVQGPTGVDQPFKPGWIARSADGQTLAAHAWVEGGQQSIVIWIDTGTWQIINAVRLSIRGPEGVTMLQQIVDGHVFVYVGEKPGEDARLYSASQVPNELARGLRVATADSGAKSAIALGPDGLLYLVGEYGAILRVNPSTLEVDPGGFKDPPEGFVTSALGVSSDAKMLYTVRTDGSYVVLDAETGKELLRRPRSEVGSILQVNQGE